MSYAVVIPCYRSASMLPVLVPRVLEVMRQHTDDFSVILVVDGSPDDTWDVARKLAHEFEPVRAIELSRNFGQQSALVAGIRSAKADVIITMDDDLQHLPEELPKLIEALTPRLDLVYGTAEEEEHGWFRSLASRLLKRMMARNLGVPGATDISALRAFRGDIVGAFDGLDGPYTSVDVALSWATNRVGSVKVRMDHRAEGQSGYSMRALVRTAITLVVGYSIRPLRLVTGLGFLAGALGLCFLAYTLIAYITSDQHVPGFASLASLISLFSGAQMVAVGIVGEYLGRVHLRMMGRPTYVIRNVID